MPDPKCLFLTALYVFACTCIHAQINIFCLFKCTHICIHVCLCVHIYVCAYVYLNMCKCVCVLACLCIIDIWIYEMYL